MEHMGGFMNVKNCPLCWVISLGFALSLSASAPCRAQEVNPDHFELTNVASSAQPEKSSSRQANSAMSEFHGAFSLSHKVQCAGMTLLPGIYQLTLRSQDNHTALTFSQRGSSVTVPAVEIARHVSAGRSGAFLRRNGDDRSLEAVFLEKPGMMVFLTPRGKQLVASTSNVAERVPLTAAASNNPQVAQNTQH
jgi:hypothetical protein